MNIQYYLMPNSLTPDPDDQSARVHSKATVTMATLIERLMRRGTTVTEPDVNAVAHLLFDEWMHAILSGETVITPLGTPKNLVHKLNHSDFVRIQ